MNDQFLVEDATESAEGSATATPLLQVESVALGYQQDGAYVPAVGQASFEVRAGEKILLLGPSGCGKSTLLKAIAGFLTPTAGRIVFDGHEGLEPGPDRAVVFQEFDQLFPWRTVLDNVAYPLRLLGENRAAARERAVEYLEMMGLGEALGRHPHQLSGGMKQRVAIARALALKPAMLLMDEPFGALDAQTRSRLQRELNEIAERTGVTILFVTHSIEEAILLGHRVVVLGERPSRVVDIADTAALDRPDSEEFIETGRHLRGLLAGEGEDQDHVAFG